MVDDILTLLSLFARAGGCAADLAATLRLKSPRA